jgi:hypothetical protein
MASDFKLDPYWWRALTAGPEAQAAVDAKADAIGRAIDAQGEVDHGGAKIEAKVKHGTRDMKAAQAWVGLPNRYTPEFARQIEASRGILNKAMGS